MTELFNQIHEQDARHIDLFEEMGVLKNTHYFSESIIGEGENYRTLWLERALNFTRTHSCSVVCLDPDNGIEPASMSKLSSLKQGKYATYGEIDAFFGLKNVDHVVIYQHFHRQQSHERQMKASKALFEQHYQGRGRVTIIRHNPVQARFYIILSKANQHFEPIHSLDHITYGIKTFFSVL